MADPSPTNTASHAAAAAAATTATTAGDTATGASPASTSSSPKSASATPRRNVPRHKPRPVIYKSSNLALAAPELVARASPEAVSAVRSIQNANATAERVRDAYRTRKEAQLVGDAIVGTDDESNAKKYERRLKMNRQSAAASRVRREAYTKALEAELVNMEATYRNLADVLERERSSNNGQAQSDLLMSTVSAGNDASIENAGQQDADAVSTANDVIDQASPCDDVEDVEVDEIETVERVDSIAGADEGQTGATEAGSRPVHVEPFANAVASSASSLQGATEKTEDMLPIDYDMLMSNFQLSPDLMQSFTAPTNPPIPDCFTSPDEAAAEGGSSHIFDFLHF